MAAPLKHMTRINALSLAKLTRCLIDGDLSCMELAAESGLHYTTVLRYARALHREGAAFIADWSEDTSGRRIIKIYKIGIGNDVIKPRQSNAERMRMSRARAKQLKAINLIAGGSHGHK